MHACLSFPRVAPPGACQSSLHPDFWGAGPSCSLAPRADPGPWCPLMGSGPCLSDVEVLKVERVQLLDAVLNLCTYHHPENIQLPPG